MIKKLLVKIILVSAPLLLLTVGFIVLDPFKIIWSYRDYSKNCIAIPNRDYVSTEVYKKNRMKYRYNSFIFGSSRTLAYKPEHWRKYLDSTASPFVFDASTETVFGICTKIRYIDKMGDSIKNALVILCPDWSFAVEGDCKGHLFMKHPAVVGTSWFHFYEECFKAYLDWGFIKNYYRFLLTRRFSPSMNGFFESRTIVFDTITNEQKIVSLEKELENPDRFYGSRTRLFYQRKETVVSYGSGISPAQEKLLNEIHHIFLRHHTRYAIVVSPLYNQKKLNEADFQLLVRVFGKENVFDFSGKNAITDRVQNYYETSHYRPLVGDTIMKIVYSRVRS
jgi:hypothetical protein